ncbi:MAG: c-type cytochrome [Candidatus Scalindua rubra]|uniref:Cytochrome c-553 n=1 Tax=Candidatus Scalindua brodae TaxID=237368 RepID=A0A0B0EIF5_9BACT|nr:MAG: cytochrome c-553 [Candidatus Scalindua brodae]MBZ0109391.1 c-type cytochrome [Candidatus Scalindua rubra]TWU34821.1 Cbb3-type cytochrome c oxidase subunit CcoP [Candidatus Brocadiaceae bacterium S225]
MKKKVIYGLVVLFFFSVVQFNASNAFAGKINYKKIFENNCRKCHGKDGKGTKRGKGLGVPDFTDGDWQDATTDKQMITTITNGKKRMPKQGHKLSPEEIKAMVKYIRFFKPKKRH